jgi:hypothetical protein
MLLLLLGVSLADICLTQTPGRRFTRPRRISGRCLPQFPFFMWRSLACRKGLLSSDVPGRIGLLAKEGEPGTEARGLFSVPAPLSGRKARQRGFSCRPLRRDTP